jgi:hypothetical protein
MFIVYVIWVFVCCLVVVTLRWVKPHLQFEINLKHWDWVGKRACLARHGTDWATQAHNATSTDCVGWPVRIEICSVLIIFSDWHTDGFWVHPYLPPQSCSPFTEVCSIFNPCKAHEKYILNTITLFKCVWIGDLVGVLFNSE